LPKKEKRKKLRIGHRGEKKRNRYIRDTGDCKGGRIGVRKLSGKKKKEKEGGTLKAAEGDGAGDHRQKDKVLLSLRGKQISAGIAGGEAKKSKKRAKKRGRIGEWYIFRGFTNYTRREAGPRAFGLKRKQGQL